MYPLFVPVAPREELMEGYLTGGYCLENEVITWRKLRFPAGVRVGDVVAFPNTAGYLSHFLESRSHQFPLTRNLVLSEVGSRIRSDPIDLI